MGEVDLYSDFPLIVCPLRRLLDGYRSVQEASDGACSAAVPQFCPSQHLSALGYAGEIG
jgi:hypothetical protein